MMATEKTAITEINRKENNYDEKDVKSIKNFYEELAPQAYSLRIPVDIELIVTEGFPCFEKTLGEEGWEKVQSYYGLNGKKPKSTKSSDIAVLMNKLRTIENAQYYISGFKELLAKCAQKICRAPRNMSDLEKAKLVRMLVLFYGYYVFIEDYSRFGENVVLDYEKAEKLNKVAFYPEELFDFYNVYVSKFNDKSLLYDAIIGELQAYDKKVRGEILDFAELKLQGDKVVSTNERKSGKLTFGNVRTLKHKMFERVGYFPPELYFCKDVWKTLEFGEIYMLYKNISCRELETFESHTRMTQHVEGSRFFEKEEVFWKIQANVEMTGKQEVERFKRFTKYLAKTNRTMEVLYLSDDKKNVEKEKIKIGEFFSFIEFAYQLGYLSQESNVNEDFNTFIEFSQKDQDKLLSLYNKGKMSAEELKAELKIDEEFEEEVFGIKHLESPVDAVKRFATENGFATSENISNELVENVLIAHNEKLWERFSSGELSSEKIIEKIGLDKSIAEMYFNLQKVDIPLIEEKLQELKNKRATAKEMKKQSLTINLYCYIIEGQIACGIKNKIPKGSKRLKPSILKKLLTA